MKTLISLAGGGSVLNIWKRIPASVKVPAIFGLGVLAAAELNIDANHSWFSNRIFGGQAAQGEAQVVDPAATRKAIAAGQPVTGAEATLAAQYQGLDADAKQKAAYADAANESEDEILAKKAAGRRLTTTEELRLAEIRAKRAEAEKQEAEAAIAKARAGYAKAYSEAEAKQKQADAGKAAVMWRWLQGERSRNATTLSGGPDNDPGNDFGRMTDEAWRSLSSFPEVRDARRAATGHSLEDVLRRTSDQAENAR